MNNYDTYFTVKRVYCLYRVSTLGQVEKDDIPMQKQRCREFAAAQGWSIVRELSEKGVSGFKVSARDRDAIQEIQRDAVDGKFDILLVFMFDRLGRRDDETPFVVEWFVRNGIEVWSATEGQQRFDNHVDKLMNYIRYWQASGESIKTSIRVKTRLGQMTEAGLYTGGTVPFGYHLEKRGRVNKRNREVCDLAIDEDEAEIVRLIFRKYVDEGYGAQRLCKYLHESGIHSRDGKGFPNTTINRIIKNVMYTGIIKNGDSRSAYLEELRIIDDATFDRAQQIMRERTMPRSSVPRNCKGSSLLVGNIFCAHCGNIAFKLVDKGVPLMCCGQKMTELVANTTDAAQEKHVPVVEKDGDKLIVSVGSVEHPMTEEHHIAWIAVETKNGSQIKYLDHTGAPKVDFALGGEDVEAVYAYCNLHGLWKA